MNTDLLLRVADTIESTQRFNMRYVAEFRDATICGSADGHQVTGVMLAHNCATVGCVAGWVGAVLEHPEYIAMETAGEFLELSEHEQYRLFFADAKSIWTDLAGEYGWELDDYGCIRYWERITADQAAEVLRRIAGGDVSL